MCSIRLSEPLLKLRPRKDLVECLGVTGFQTLLHEMIHAYLFVTNNDKDREGHGPEFCKHMHRINRLTGANITIYHTFHDEVDEYRRHWWRCDGPCQFQKPYYGYVKRATNRAPSAHDYWWAEHQSTCGGTYIKIKEPENYSKKGKGKTKLAAAENKDKTNGVVPFSGRGHVLGETNNLLSSGRFTTSRANKTQDPSGPDHSASAVRWNAKTEAKFEQNGSRKKTASPVLNTSRQSVVSNYFPRASVANQKAFRSVSGSPTKGAAVGDTGKSSASAVSQRRTSSSKAALRNSLKAVEVMSETASRDRSRAEAEPPRKQRRREDKTVFDNFFIKKEKTRSDGGCDPQCSSRPAAATQSSGSSTSQSTTVACPVCQSEVLEAQINEHLDVCLEGESSKVKRKRNL
ncbi:PREDICTED: sprT-like domain-containing protein Spartan isoform X1 [Myotis brandtii]|uniref:sprT-like domain-containing protein Spartan isoform X1 n=2 Tax=Myotis brandtii TaxID=109478 RepID=UPI00070440FA|nr:PREDICTED: sprT-like domain-containing protein Spartan isoform X1 [Myotis brandtii]XP_014391288.1 PREDICTED: sprT-like domain-containing protein Spartan isoform X1 [Myotis brandtii]